MLENCVGDSRKMMMTALAFLVTKHNPAARSIARIDAVETIFQKYLMQHDWSLSTYMHLYYTRASVNDYLIHIRYYRDWQSCA